MQTKDPDLGHGRIPTLFKTYFVPTLIGMLSICGVTAIDGIFIGHGVGSDGLAAVNICFAPLAAFTGIGLMLGVGASVVSAIALAESNLNRAKLNITQSMLFGTAIVIIFLMATLFDIETTGRILGASSTLMPLVKDYMVWMFPAIIFQLWEAIGLFVVRLDGSPKYAMWCNLAPALINIILDWLFVFPLGMGVEGAAIATMIATATGGIMVMAYIISLADKLRFARIGECFTKFISNIFSQCKIGLSALLGEVAIGIVMFMGNIQFMSLAGDAGVGAFSIACYYMPFVFMVGNAIAQSAQPIISYNYGIGQHIRVVLTEKIALATALVCGVMVTGLFILAPNLLVGLFIDSSSPSSELAIKGLPLFAVAFVPFILNLTIIGYYQSVERNSLSLWFALLRGSLFLVPSFILMPTLGLNGLWLSLAVSECATLIGIILLVGWKRFNRL